MVLRRDKDNDKPHVGPTFSVMWFISTYDLDFTMLNLKLILSF